MSKTVLISGAAGFIGTHLIELLVESGYKVKILTRSSRVFRENIVYWSPEKGKVSIDELEDLYAVVHLAGEKIASRRWTAHQKQLIRDSRVQGTRVLCEGLAGGECREDGEEKHLHSRGTNPNVS